MDKNTSVFTVKKILDRSESITTVVHDYEGEWQFLGNGEVTISDLLIISLNQLLEIDNSIESLLNMSKGVEANRVKDGEWSFTKLEH